MKKLKLFISLWFTMFSIVMFGQAEYEKIAITQNTQDNTAGRLLVQDVTTGEVRWILKSILDNKFNQPTGDATQYLDGAGNPTTFPVLSQSDRVITEVRNSTGATITKGTVVYLNGATGGKPNVQKAQANSEATSSGTFGVIQSDINNNSNGYVVVIGTVLGLNTSAYTAGQVLWLSPTTAGGFTTTKPVAPNHAVYVGIVTLAATQGTIEVKIQNGYELDEIHDVLITSKTDNDGLIYESSSGLWKNKQITKAMVGLANVDNTSDLNKPISTATQTALNLKENTANKNTANGYAGLGSDGKLISSQLPAITITDTFVVGSQAAMLALTAETGDVAVRTDVNKSFILKGTSAGTLADWQELLTPTSSVTSVFGRQGAVTANNGDYTTALVTETTNKRYQTDIQQTYNDATSSIQTQLNSKANDNSVVHLAGTESVTGAKTFTATPSFDNNIFLKKTGSWANISNYSVIGGMTNGFVLSSETNKHAYLDLFQLTQARQYDFPNKSGTFAMTSDVPTISGTTNYVTKFTGASTLGNSQIFDNGSGIGIGSASPSEILHLRSSQPVIRFEKTGILNWKIGNISGNNFTINTDSGGGDALSINTSGNIGIANVSPNYKLQVSPPATYGNAEDGNISISASASGGSTTSPTTAGGIVFGDQNVTNGYAGRLAVIQDNPSATTATHMRFYINTGGGNNSATERMRILSNGQVRIGTTLPLVFSNDLTEPSLVNGMYYTSDNTGYGFSIGKMVSGVKTKQLVINDAGNVGVGSLTPGVRFVNSGGGNSDGPTFGSGTVGSDAILAGNGLYGLYTGVSNAGHVWQQVQRNDGSTAVYPLSLQPAGGNVGIGTTNPVVKFEVQSSGVSARFASSTNVVPVSIFNTGSSVSTIGFKGSTTSNDYVVRVGADANNFVAFTSDTERMRITDAGATSFTGSVTATAFFQSSDLRLKDIVKRDGDVIKYKWKDKRDDKIHIGYVAQEVQKENPDQVNVDEKGILSVNYIEILVQKIKDLENRIKQLEK